MANLRYPLSLPGPTDAPFEYGERREITALPGARTDRALTHDRSGTQTVTFIFITQQQVDEWFAWIDDTLLNAGAYFAAYWAFPFEGGGVVRFVTEPTYPTFIPEYGWFVQAQVELRGRAFPPDDSGAGTHGGAGGDGIAWLNFDPQEMYPEADLEPGASEATNYPIPSRNGKLRAGVINPAADTGYTWNVEWAPLHPEDAALLPTKDTYYMSGVDVVFATDANRVEFQMATYFPDYIFELPQGILTITVSGVPGSLIVVIGEPAEDHAYSAVSWMEGP